MAAQKGLEVEGSRLPVLLSQKEKQKMDRCRCYRRSFGRIANSNGYKLVIEQQLSSPRVAMAAQKGLEVAGSRLPVLLRQEKQRLAMCGHVSIVLCYR
jgi:hypothetical protein